MVEQLASRLTKEKDDFEGWISYLILTNICKRMIKHC